MFQFLVFFKSLHYFVNDEFVQIAKPKSYLLKVFIKYKAIYYLFGDFTLAVHCIIACV